MLAALAGLSKATSISTLTGADSVNSIEAFAEVEKDKKCTLSQKNCNKKFPTFYPELCSCKCDISQATCLDPNRFDPWYPHFDESTCSCISNSPTRQIIAQPYNYTMRTTEVALIVIDMQRDFLLPGGFGEALGNDVSGMLAIVPTVQNLIAEARLAGIKVIHTRENHEPDGSDLLESKYYRGMVGKRIGDPSPLGGRLLIKGDYGAGIVDECAPLPGELVIDAAGKGKFWNTNLDRELKAAGIT